MTQVFDNQFRVWGEGAPQGVFLAANGFPVGSYDFLLSSLAQGLPLAGLESRGAWPAAGSPRKGFTWEHHAEDLIDFLQSGSLASPAIGIGHSIGATVTTMAAAKRPDLFRGLVLIDPATIPGRWLPWIVKAMPGISARMALVQSTERRRVHWPSPQAFHDYYAAKSVYRSFSDEAMRDYTAAGLRETSDGYELAYSREWEAWNFQHTAEFWPRVRELPMPALILRGEKSYLHPDAEFKRQCRRLPPHIEALSVAGAGHMLPQEAGAEVLRLIKTWLEQLA